MLDENLLIGFRANSSTKILSRDYPYLLSIWLGEFKNLAKVRKYRAYF